MKSAIIRCACACGWSIFAAACTTAPRSFTVDDFASVQKVDIHVHINSTDSALIDQAEADHFRLLTINVDYPDFPPLADQRRIALAQTASHPARVAYAATFSMKGWDDPDWQQRG